MWTNQDEMFADDEPSDDPVIKLQSEDEEKINERTVTLIDQLALKIFDGQISVNRVDKFRDFNGITTLELTYVSH
jgi:hypothetical protein